MKRLWTVAVVLALVASACGDDSATGTGAGEPPDSVASTVPVVSDVDRLPVEPDAPVSPWVDGINAAGWRLHQTLPEGNAVSSPLSIGTAFSFARGGASEDTGAVLDEIFGFPAGLDAHAAANAATSALAEASTGTTTLDIANRLFPNLTFQPSQEFLDLGARYYGSGVEPIDTTDGVAAAATINGWVDGQTRGLIEEIVTPGVVQNKDLFLVNTVYLFAEWATPFLADLTFDGDFTTASGDTVSVPFMTSHEPVPRRFVELPDADAVELPYTDGDLAMWLIVPHADDGLDALEDSLSAADLVGLGEQATEGLVQLTMPKWEQELPPYDLFGWLCPEGLCAGAGFSGISSGLFISDALHGARIVVDEAGTEAAAVTAIGFVESAGPLADLTLTADHPFLWAIVHEPTDSLVFVGRLTDPAAE